MNRCIEMPSVSTTANWWMLVALKKLGGAQMTVDVNKLCSLIAVQRANLALLKVIIGKPALLTAFLIKRGAVVCRAISYDLGSCIPGAYLNIEPAQNDLICRI